MKTCNDCAYAKWERSKNGNLHPSGDGKCTYPYKVPPLPASMYWLSASEPCGGQINRKETLKDHCPYWQRRDVSE